MLNLYNLNINNIFNIYSKFYFRIIENKILKYFLIKNYYNSYILSIGGGSSCYFNNIKLMNKFSNTFYLNVNKNNLYKRLLKNNNFNRPLINKKKNLFKFIIKHIKKRNFFYKKSKYIILIKNKNISIIIKKIINIISNIYFICIKK
ncbi:MAG: shikimate kinase [Candidatus Shikimatogenerans bostrichidophilus]|nr:MAG: shikimate kinase [Candidatus Shikimatogenerans bostrichidophilus]